MFDRHRNVSLTTTTERQDLTMPLTTATIADGNTALDDFYRCTGMAPKAGSSSSGTATDYITEWSELRAQGATYREIGMRYGFSHERVRQVIGHLQVAQPAEIQRQIRAREIAGWVTDNGPVPLSRLTSELGISERQLMYYARKVPGVIPLHLVILSARPTVQQYSHHDLIEALQEVWTRLPASRRSSGLSHVRYEKFRRGDQPSSAQVINRLGKWESACQSAGVPSGTWTRPKESYASKWSDAEILEIVAAYTRHASSQGIKPTYLGYDRYQLGRDDLPSGSTVRNRMRTIGLRTWPEILDSALGREDSR